MFTKSSRPDKIDGQVRQTRKISVYEDLTNADDWETERIGIGSILIGFLRETAIVRWRHCFE